jgi:hypothetical protein
MRLANDADVRVTPPKAHRVAACGGKIAEADLRPDNRLPTAGDTIVRIKEGRQICVVVVANGFEYGRSYKSLSAVAKAISGSHCNGFRFFGLEGKRRSEKQNHNL